MAERWFLAIWPDTQARAALELHTPIGWTARELVLAHGVSGERPRYRLRYRYPLP